LNDSNNPKHGIHRCDLLKGDVDSVFMARPEDTYAVGVTYQGDEETDRRRITQGAPQSLLRVAAYDA
jgi:hypothetical protein